MDIKKAFEKDGFKVTGSVTTKGCTGYVAESKKAVNYLDGKMKKAYYLEGGAREIGYQMGYLASNEVLDMVKNFPYEVITGFFAPQMSAKIKKLLYDILMFIIRNSIYGFIGKIPIVYVQEAWGILEGVKAANKSAEAKKLTFEDIWVMNVGIDVLVSEMSNPSKLLQEIADSVLAKKEKYKPKETDLRYPHFCNAYSAFAGAVKNKNHHFFGRDWMFNGGEVLENNAALIIVKPNDKRNSLVYGAAPGLIGAAVAMNSDGVAMGVDLVPAANATPQSPGFNSILLVRDSIHRSSSAAEVVENVIKADRGAPYIYPVADGKSNRACVIEAGMKVENLDPLSYIPENLKNLYPTKKFLDTHAEKPVQGLVARWNDYKQPQDFIKKYNPGIFKNFGKTFDIDKFGEKELLYQTPYDDPNGFGFYYFAPERVEKNDYIVVSNAYITPPMNLCMMTLFSNLAHETFWTDPQWRYDYLNKVILERHGSIDWESAWQIINFQSPVMGIGEGKKYYTIPKAPWKLPKVTYKDRSGKVQKTWKVDGITSLLELRSEKKIRSLYGTYADDFVEITLPNYL